MIHKNKITLLNFMYLIDAGGKAILISFDTSSDEISDPLN
jgi:hypothetical protein